MSKVIEVKYKQQQDDNELYVSTGFLERHYFRQPSSDKNRVIWSVAKETRDGCEVGAPVKAGTTIRVVIGKKKEKVVLFEETVTADEVNGAVSAEKRENFVCDLLKEAVEGLSQKLSLHDYESWAKWLLKECAKHNYTGYQDNWLHFGTRPAEEVEVETLEILGHTFTVVMTDWSHMVCDKTWKVVEIRDANNNALELCGYSYDA